jgi:hypothetical protein
MFGPQRSSLELEKGRWKREEKLMKIVTDIYNCDISVHIKVRVQRKFGASVCLQLS